MKDIKFDRGSKNFQPTNLEVTKININNSADNVIPAMAEATFNIRFNNKHTSNSLKQKINKFLIKINKKNYSNQTKIIYYRRNLRFKIYKKNITWSRIWFSGKNNA